MPSHKRNASTETASWSPTAKNHRSLTSCSPNALSGMGKHTVRRYLGGLGMVVGLCALLQLNALAQPSPLSFLAILWQKYTSETRYVACPLPLAILWQKYTSKTRCFACRRLERIELENFCAAIIFDHPCNFNARVGPVLFFARVFTRAGQYDSTGILLGWRQRPDNSAQQVAR